MERIVIKLSRQVNRHFRRLKNRMDKLGIECVRRMDTDYTSPLTEPVEETVKFLEKHFSMPDHAQTSSPVSPTMPPELISHPD
ncbi:MAG: hypothetical protein ACYS14_05120 [Planctomycetota bacterium]|jgi:hypothetical protein